MPKYWKQKPDISSPIVTESSSQSNPKGSSKGDCYRVNLGLGTTVSISRVFLLSEKRTGRRLHARQPFRCYSKCGEDLEEWRICRESVEVPLEAPENPGEG